MSAETPVVVAGFPVGSEFRCTLTLMPPKIGEFSDMIVEWQPPLDRPLTAQEVSDYRSGRNEVIGKLVGITGDPVFVMDDAASAEIWQRKAFDLDPDGAGRLPAYRDPMEDQMPKDKRHLN